MWNRKQQTLNSTEVTGVRGGAVSGRVSAEIRFNGHHLSEGMSSGELRYCVVTMFNNNVSYFWKGQIDLVIPQDVHMPHFAFRCCDKHHHQKQCGEERVNLAYTPGKPEQDSRQEPGGRSWSRAHSLLAPQACSACFSIQLRTTCPGTGRHSPQWVGPFHILSN